MGFSEHFITADVTFVTKIHHKGQIVVTLPLKNMAEEDVVWLPIFKSIVHLDQRKNTLPCP